MQQQMQCWDIYYTEQQQGRLPCIERQHKCESDCALLDRLHVHLRGPFAAECECSNARSMLVASTPFSGLRSHLNCADLFSISSWHDVHAVKRLPMSSPSSLALYSQMTVLTLAASVNATEVHVLGALKEAYQPESWVEAALVLRSVQLSRGSPSPPKMLITLFGPGIRPRTSEGAAEQVEIADAWDVRVIACNGSYYKSAERVMHDQRRETPSTVLGIALDAGLGGDASAWSLSMQMAWHVCNAFVLTDMTEEAAERAKRAWQAVAGTGNAKGTRTGEACSGFVALNALRKPVPEVCAEHMLPTFRAGFVVWMAAPSGGERM